MLIVNYRKLFEVYDHVINRQCSQLAGFDEDSKKDCYQHICIHIFKYIRNIDFSKSNLDYYVFVMSRTGLRQFIYDRTRQNKFEDEFILGHDEEWRGDDEIQEENTVFCSKIKYDKIVSETVAVLEPIDIAIFYSLLYNRDNKKYTDIAKMMRIDYPSFIKHVNQIRKKVSKVLENI